MQALGIIASNVGGAQSALEEQRKIMDIPSLKSYHLLHSTMAEFYIKLNWFKEAQVWLRTIIKLSPLQA
jgi:predicted RNA polymerase sigma factor